MTTALDILNLGLSKISVSSISSIDPPKTAIERKCAAHYPFWRDKQLAKKKWTFALAEADLTASTIVEGHRLPYRYLLPNDCVRPLRDRLDGSTITWERRGKYLWSPMSSLTLPYIQRVSENDFDPAFIDVLACWCAFELAETTTESNVKKSTAKTMYDEALLEAAKQNAFIIGEEDITNEFDEGYSFVEDRW